MMVHGMSLQASLEEGKLNSLDSTESSGESIILKGLESYWKSSGLSLDELQALSNKESVQAILANASYLNSIELFIKFKLEAEYQDNVDLQVAIFMKSNEEKSLGIDKRSIADRMIAHVKLNEEQLAKIERLKELSWQQIEIEVADKVDNDDVCMNIGREICKSKIRDQITEEYKNHTAQQLCDEVNKFHNPSKLVVGVYRGLVFNKVMTEVAQYAAQQDIFDMNIFIESKHSKADSNRITSESSQK